MNNVTDIMTIEPSHAVARALAAADEARRRIERDLHDGAQQRLASLALTLRAAADDVTCGVGELRDELTRARRAR